MFILPFSLYFFFFNDTATTEIYTLSLHDALPIYLASLAASHGDGTDPRLPDDAVASGVHAVSFRSEEHTSELQSRLHLVCRLLLEKKKKNANKNLKWTSKNNNTNRPLPSKMHAEQ